MKCDHCGSEWTSSPGLSVSMTNCPFCGKSLLPKQKNLGTVEDVLVEINRRFGISALTDTTKLVGYFADLAPQLYSKQRRILGYFAECNGPQKLTAVMNAPENEQLICMKQIIREMKDEMFIDETASRMICNAFLFSLSGHRLAEPEAEKQSWKRISGTSSLQQENTKEESSTAETLMQVSGQAVSANQVQSPAGKEYYQDLSALQLDAVRLGSRIASNGDGLVCVSSDGEIFSSSVNAALRLALVTAGSFAPFTMKYRFKGWRWIQSVAAGYDHFVGLRDDGTVVASGNNEFGQCNVKGWKDVVSVSASGNNTYGLLRDGHHILVAGTFSDDLRHSETLNIHFGSQRLVRLYSCDEGTLPQLYALLDNGTVANINSVSGSNLLDASRWNNIVALAVNARTIIGLRADGTVLAEGDNEFGQCEVSGWNHIIAIAATDVKTVGLRPDGTVISVGKTYDDEGDVSSWKKIVAISGGDNIYGLTSDGNLVSDFPYFPGKVAKWKLL